MLERAELVPATKSVTLWRVKLKYIVGPLSSDTDHLEFTLFTEHATEYGTYAYVS